MLLQLHARKTFLMGLLMLAFAVALGAFGAHGLKQIVSAERLITFETGVRYHFYHGVALVLVALTQQVLPTINLRASVACFFAGILLFSFNCYFYVISEIKIFAMVIPLGGSLFILGWVMFAVRILKFGK